MSNGRARPANVHPRYDAAHRVCDDGELSGVQPAWCLDETDLDEARRLTHDGLVGAMGRMRTGPVSWRWYKGADANAAISSLMEDTDENMRTYLRAIRGKLREYGGLLVLATAPGDPEAEP